MASVISFVALSQTLITELYLSSFEIKPLLYCFVISSTLASEAAKISFFSSGTITSAIDTVIAPFVEYL